MRAVFCTFALVALFAYVQATGTCNNPIFSQSGAIPEFLTGDHFSGLLNRKTTPSMTSGLPVCTLWNGKESCCEADTFAPIVSTIHGIDESIRQSQQLLSQIPPGAINAGIDQNADLTPAQKAILKRIVGSVLGLIGPAINCYGGMMTYMQGILCTACSPDADTFYADHNPGALALNLADKTCSGLYGACSGLLNGVQSLALDMLDVALDSGNSLTPEQKAEIQKLKGEIAQEGMCKGIMTANNLAGSTCQDLLCNHMIGGLNINTFNMSIPSSGTGGGIGFGNNFASHVAALPMLTQQAVTNFAQTYSVEAVLPLSLHLYRMVHANEPTNSMPSLQSAMSGNVQVTNEYSNSPTAYDAYSVGCSSGSLSSHNCPQPKDDKTPGWVIAVAVICSLLGVALIAYGGYYFYKRHKAQQAALSMEPHAYTHLEGSHV